MDELGNVYISNGVGVLAFDPNGNNILKNFLHRWVGDQQHVRRAGRQDAVHHRPRRPRDGHQDECERCAELG